MSADLAKVRFAGALAPSSEGSLLDAAMLDLYDAAAEFVAAGGAGSFDSGDGEVRVGDVAAAVALHRAAYRFAAAGLLQAQTYAAATSPAAPATRRSRRRG